MNKRLKIGLFIDTFFPMIDGVIMVTDNYARLLNKIADVTVFAPSPDRHYVDNFPYKVVRCTCVKTGIIDYALPLPDTDVSFKRQLDASDLDIVHIHSPFTIGLDGLRYAEKHRIPAIVTLHSQYKKDFKRSVKSEFVADMLTKNLVRFFNRCDECWAVNKRVADIFYRDYGVAKLPRVMNNATDMLPVPNRDEAIRLVNKEYGLNPDDKVLLFVGRLNKLKNILLIADALKILNDHGTPFRMLFAGDGQDRAELEKRVHDNGIANKVTFCGRVTDRDLLASLYARAELFLFPSLYDASSLVQIEAASQRLPVIFLRGSATSATVTEDVNGFIADPDVESFAAKVEQVLTNPGLREKVAAGAFRDLYRTWDQAVAEAYGIYCRLSEAKSSMPKK